jgi:hypothetical protein
MWNLTDFVTNPHIILTIIYLLVFELSTRKKWFNDLEILRGITFLFIGLMINTFLVLPLSFINILAYLLFLLILFLTERFQYTKSPKITLLFLGLSIVVSLIISQITYPIFNQLENWNIFFMTIITPKIKIPYFYIYIPLLSLTSFFCGYCLLFYWDRLIGEIMEKRKTSISSAQSIFFHLQLIPLILSPMLIAQIFGRTEWLEPLTYALFFISVTQLVLLVYCPIVAILGDRIIGTRFLWLSSIYSLCSFISSIYVAFQFILSNVNNGTLALAITVALLFASALGTALSRIT